MGRNPNNSNSVNGNKKNKRAEEFLQRSKDIAKKLNQLLNLSLIIITLQQLLEEALELILSILWLVFKAKGSIFLLENDHLVMKAQKDQEVKLQRESRQLSLERCPCGKAASTGEIQV